MNRCLDIQWGMHMAERDKVCVCRGGRGGLCIATEGQCRIHNTIHT